MLLKKNDRIVFLGDSLTCRTGVLQNPDPAVRYKLDYAGSYVDILVKRLLVHFPELELSIYNKGIGGNTVYDLLERAERDVLRLKPDWVVLLIGQNDAGRHTAADFYSGLNQLLDLFRQHNIRTLLLSTTPNPRPERKDILDQLDTIIQTLALHFDLVAVDVKSPFEKVMTCNLPSGSPVALFNDGCHLSELGNLLLADLVFDALSGTSPRLAEEKTAGV